MSLSDQDKRMIAKAREVAGLDNHEARQERYGDSTPDMSRAAEAGEAKFLLIELVAIIERLERGHG
jgi:hypothetical protein